MLLKKSNGEAVTVKLSGIDCPKKGQSHFIKARLFASQRVLDREVMVQPEKGPSESGQPPSVTILYIEEGSQMSLNSELLEAGMARRSAPHGSADLTLGEIEAEARKLRRGLWADPRLPPAFGFLPIK
jgi:endonuclease YncB( thermonuclease family)